MEFDLKEGLKYTSTKLVDLDDTALAHGSGQLQVFATPAMVALMENAAMNVVSPYLPENMDTVGVEINVEHTKASTVGATIEATATLIKIEGRRLIFAIKASDNRGEIGNGTHIRFIIDKEKFMSKLNN